MNKGFRELVSGFASLVGLPVPEFTDDDVCAYTLPSGKQLEISVNKDEDAILLFCEVEREESEDPADWRRWLELSLTYSNPYGLYFVCDPRNGTIFLTRHFPTEGATPESLAKAAESMLGAMDQLDQTRQSEDSVEAEVPDSDDFPLGQFV